MTEYFRFIVRFSHVFFISTCCDAKYQSTEWSEPEEIQDQLDHVSEGRTMEEVSGQESEQVGEQQLVSQELHG